MNLKEIGNVFTSKPVGTGPSSYEKKNLPGRRLNKVWETLIVHRVCARSRVVHVTCCRFYRLGFTCIYHFLFFVFVFFFVFCFCLVSLLHMHGTLTGKLSSLKLIIECHTADNMCLNACRYFHCKGKKDSRNWAWKEGGFKGYMRDKQTLDM